MVPFEYTGIYSRSKRTFSAHLQKVKAACIVRIHETAARTNDTEHELR